MKHFTSCLLGACFVAIPLTSAQGALTFSGPSALVSAYTDGTFSPVPPVGLTITSPPAGINLTGDFFVNVPAGTTTGFLTEWVVDRPISGGTGPVNITVNYTGFTSFTGGPGANNLTAGVMSGYIYNSGVVLPGSMASVNFTQSGLLTNYLLSNTVTLVSYTYTPGDTLRLSYFVDLNYSGLPGQFDVNFPASVLVTNVPEPMMGGLMVLAVSVLGRRHRTGR